MFIDTSNTGSDGGNWGRKVREGLRGAAPGIFKNFGVTATVLELKNELRAHPPSESDYVLVINPTYEYSGSNGSYTGYSVDLFNRRSAAKIWSGSASISWTANVFSDDLGQRVATDIAASLNAAKLLPGQAGGVDANALSTSQRGDDSAKKLRDALATFKAMKAPKVLAVTGDGVYFYETGRASGQKTPAERALADCETKQFKNCRIVADEQSVF